MRLFESLASLILIFLSLGTFSASASPAGNTVENGLHNNEDGSPLIPLIDSSRGSLDIEIYTMTDPEVRAAIRSALSRKVRVRIIKDPSPVSEACDVFSEKGGDADCADQKKLVSEVRAAGGAFLAFNKSTLCGGKDPSRSCFEHGKIAIADHNQALISSGNFDSSNLCDVDAHPERCNRDYSYVVEEKETLSALNEIFERDLEGKSYDLPSLLARHPDSHLTVSPHSLQPLLDFVASARESIRVENQYLKEPAFNKALEEAAARGVRVQVTVASACAFARPTKSETAEITRIYSAFDKAGIESRMFNASQTIRGIPGYMHAKAIVVDDDRAWVGSINGSTTAFTMNREFGIFFVDSSDVRLLTQVMSSDFEDSRAETWTQSLGCVKDRSGL